MAHGQMAHTFHRYSFSSAVFSLGLHSSLFAVEPIDLSVSFNIDLFSNPRVNFELLFTVNSKGYHFRWHPHKRRVKPAIEESTS